MAVYGRSGGSGVGFMPQGTSILSNPYRVPFRSIGSQLNRAAGASGFKTVSKDEFERMSAANRFASSLGDQQPLFGQSGVLTRAGGLLNPMERTEDPEKDIAERLYGGEGNDGGSSLGSRIKRLLSGESGAAIGGIAQGAGSVIGSYLNRKTERERMKEEKRRQQILEENNRRAQALLMPMLQSEIERTRPRG